MLEGKTKSGIIYETVGPKSNPNHNYDWTYVILFADLIGWRSLKK